MSQTHVADGDYHPAIGLPDVKMPTRSVDLDPSRHAQKRARNHKYGPFDLPQSVDVKPEMYERDPDTAVDEREPHVFEVTIEDGHVEKMGVRQPYDEDFDICLIFDPLFGTLITAWLNRTDDPHDTLDESEYQKP